MADVIIIRKNEADSWNNTTGGEVKASSDIIMYRRVARFVQRTFACTSLRFTIRWPFTTFAFPEPLRVSCRHHACFSLNASVCIP